MSKLQPLNNNVVVRNREKEVKQGAIVIPDNAKEKSYEAVVVAVGNKVNEDSSVDALVGLLGGNENKDIFLKEGDVVIYGKYSGSEVTIDDEKFLILKDTDILAKIV
jgi:chaperonin GroES